MLNEVASWRWKQAWQWFPKISIIIYVSQVSQFYNFIKINQRVWGLFPKETLIQLCIDCALLMKQPQPMIKFNQGKLFHSLFYAYMSLCEYPQSFIHQDLKFGLEKLTSQVIWLNWNPLRPNFWWIYQMKITPRQKMFLITIWTTLMFIKNPFETWKVIIHFKTL